MSKRAASRAPATSHALGRRAALEGAGAAGLVVTIAGAVPTPARADTHEPSSAERPAYALPERERVLRAHALVPLSGPALHALRRCEAAGVSLVEAFAPRHGGLPFVVELPGGTRRAFELVRHDAADAAPIATIPTATGETLALLLENRGDGARASDEDDARLALRLAAALSVHGGSVLAALPLTTVRERRRSAPFATLHVPLSPGAETR